MNLQLTQHIDVALLVLDAFFLFFLGLIIYLRREDRREGYPLEDNVSGAPESYGSAFLMAPPKSFKLPFGHGTVTTPTKDREPVAIAARRWDASPGSGLVPTGDPLVDGIGPAAYAQRAKRPDVDWEGHPRIVPISTAGDFTVERRDADPRGYAVVAADGRKAGVVTDLWIDKADRLIRYLEVEIDGGRRVLTPMFMASISRSRSQVTVTAVTAAQFANVPAIEGSGVITLYEEERVQAYYGGGFLYATPERAEPLI
ncbi:photosynthetic reaction center subunit H [Sphingomonas sp.]|uniref:photosynthetic reaction center subunit H n=1 Tax=Sphingomonas sp. TaxID=28214 RepID=UPI001DA39F44|nr:photosynthetic reaction center subunit H [Sphingomonas sp.]MBX9796832.1 photosynthetic reaction center subunit H [Sphingomonas sp.]